jgi:DNA (cytosine-5)-methyltransferase 1
MENTKLEETGKKHIKVLDLFSGIGGFSLGLEQHRMETVAFCDSDAKARQVLMKHWPKVPIFDDVKTLKGAHVGSVDLICGGFPCQDISLAGKGAGLAGERSGLWWEFHRLIKEIKPRWVIAENVSALRHRGLGEVLRSLVEIGYDAEWDCIPASAVGAPHRRDRIWIVAYPRRIPTQVSPPRRLTTIEVPQRNTWWEIEPQVGRVADGVPRRLDRLKQLGNAVVPQIPALLGAAICEWETKYGIFREKQ